jgi:hypothetical protein
MEQKLTRRNSMDNTANAPQGNVVPAQAPAKKRRSKNKARYVYLAAFYTNHAWGKPLDGEKADRRDTMVHERTLPYGAFGKAEDAAFAFIGETIKHRFALVDGLRQSTFETRYHRVVITKHVIL